MSGEQPQFWDTPPARYKKKRKKRVVNPRPTHEQKRAAMLKRIRAEKKRAERARKKKIPIEVSMQASALGRRGGKRTLLKHGRGHFSRAGKTGWDRKKML